MASLQHYNETILNKTVLLEKLLYMWRNRLLKRRWGNELRWAENSSNFGAFYFHLSTFFQNNRISTTLIWPWKAAGVAFSCSTFSDFFLILQLGLQNLLHGKAIGRVSSLLDSTTHSTQACGNIKYSILPTGLFGAVGLRAPRLGTKWKIRQRIR